MHKPNKQKYTFPRPLSLLSFIACFLLSTSVWAVCDGDEGDDFYGNGQLCAFKKAIEGTEAISAQDQAYMSNVERTRIVNRWYVRGMIGQPKVKLSGLEITAPTTSPLSGAVISESDLSAHLTQFLFATGHLWEQWALEAELLFSKKLNFNQTLAGTTINLNGDMTQFALFINLQYIIPRLFSWYPQGLQIHLDAGAGPSLKRVEVTSTNADGSPRQSETKQTITPAGNLGVGARYQVTTSMLVDIAYRFFDMGKVEGSIEGADFEASKLRSNGFYIGLMYEF